GPALDEAAMAVVPGVDVLPDDLSRVVDAEGNGAAGAERIGGGGEGATAVEETVRVVTDDVHPDDLANVVDAACTRAAGAQRIVEGGEGATAEEEAVVVEIRVDVHTDDLARVVEAVGNGAAGGQGIIEVVEGIDWHDTDSSLTVSLTESVDRKAEPVSNLLSLSCIPRAALNAARTTWIAVVPWTRQPWQ